MDADREAWIRLRRSPAAMSRTARAAVLLLRTRRLLARSTLPDALARVVAPREIAPRENAPRENTAARGAPDTMAAAVERAARLVRGSGCLPRSVSLAALLAEDGHQPELVLGCRRSPTGTWLAHAWVEVGGLAVERDHEPSFMRLARASGSTSWRVEPWE